METVSLQALFEQNKQQLQASLAGLSLPQDAQKVQSIIVKFLASLITEDGEFRQSLTMSEDYILQAAFSMLTAQQDIAEEFSKNMMKSLPSQNQSQTKKSDSKVANNSVALAGTLIGSAVGGLVLGTWGAVFGAIAGTATAIYGISPALSKSKEQPSYAMEQTRESINENINTETFTAIISKICASVDNLILTIRAQNNRMRAAYENQDKPSLGEQYPALLTNLEVLFGVAESNDEDKLDTLISQIELVKRSLKNYGLTYSNGKIIKQ